MLTQKSLRPTHDNLLHIRTISFYQTAHKKTSTQRGLSDAGYYPREQKEYNID